MGEKVCACIAPQEGQAPTLPDIVRYLRDEKHVAAFKLPEYVLLLPALPRNPVGKILKSDLRAQAKARHALEPREPS